VNFDFCILSPLSWAYNPVIRKSQTLQFFGIRSHLEQGRIDIKVHHLSKLLPVLGISKGVFDAFASGKTPVPKDLRRECLELIKAMSLTQLETAHGVLISLAGKQERNV